MSTTAVISGTWKLESWLTEVVETKERLKIFGEHPDGYIIFTGDGRTFALLTAEGRKPVKSEADQISAFSTVVAYTGRYRIEGETLITTVDVSADPAWVGIELIRYFKCEGDRLEITTAPFVSTKPNLALGDKLLQSFLVWKRDTSEL
ncbi:lipocalin-like domain-containing protein [Nordella sp. HKS 07]|uniref:lipocalin-like domain-containing protein n=1 Tax=Nordella sp. HKS 07 TaxID=2712222 RepID=UPI0013E0F96C|nr:lipocalin-like domain-containing protein [Nordella sp. HKS 07]QIG46682.1 lipocalin-like domain-containing protein [Nordella sp. HKS 07]